MHTVPIRMASVAVALTMAANGSHHRAASELGHSEQGAI